ncbi:hypothetical protein D3C85_1784930 [compost metagenome]
MATAATTADDKKPARRVATKPATTKSAKATAPKAPPKPASKASATRPARVVT